MRLERTETIRKSPTPPLTRARVQNSLALVVAAVFVCMSTSVGRAEPGQHTLRCGPHKTIGDALKTLNPGDTLLVSGDCNENVEIGEEIHRITLDGRGSATITGDSSTSTVSVTGTGITIRGFTINGGSQGVAVNDGGSATIDGNTIQGATMNGITVFRNATAQIINNTIQNNLSNGINMQQAASARIGFTGSPTDRVSLPNTIQNNGAQGIQVMSGSSAQIFSNTIQNNGGHGVVVDRNSHAHITASVITGNAGDGVRAMRNAGVDFGTDSTGATPQFDDDTNTGTNGGYGIRCTIAGFVDGRLGTLTGTLGGKFFGENCTDSSAP